MWDSGKKLDNEHVLLNFAGGERNSWRLRHAFEGVQIFGGIGSGKSSGSGKTIARAFLKNGFGGLVHCAKSDEVATWLQYCISLGRWGDVVLMGEQNKFEVWAEHLEDEKRFDELDNFKRKNSWQAGNPNMFNPLRYELERQGKGAGEVFNLSNLFMEIYKMGNRFSGGGGGDKDRYWDNALKRSLNRMILLLKASDELLTIDNMVKIMASIPDEDFAKEQEYFTSDEWTNWYQKSYCVECMMNAQGAKAEARNRFDELLEQEAFSEEEQEELEGLLSTVPVLESDYENLKSYFYREFAGADEKTRSIVRESFLGLAEPFTMGILKKYFAGDLTIRPEMCWEEGKIIILNFSVKEYLDSGMYAQGIFKLMWQQAIERRKVKIHPLPCFLWVDESQYFVNEYDTIFQTTARSSRAATVFITQNISNYYSQMGGASSKSKVDSLLGNLSTKIFHANNDAVTNEWASNTIGKHIKKLTTKSENRKKYALTTDSVGTGESYQYLPQVLPASFITLASGGEGFNYKVQAIIQVKGHTWEGGFNYLNATFNQKN